MMGFATWVRDTRTAQKMTQTECAARAGMKLQQWNQIEKQVKNPERATVQNIARGLGVTEDEALQAAGYSTNPAEVPAELATIWRKVSGASLAKQKAWLEHVRTSADLIVSP